MLRHMLKKSSGALQLACSCGKSIPRNSTAIINATDVTTFSTTSLNNQRKPDGPSYNNDEERLWGSQSDSLKDLDFKLQSREYSKTEYEYVLDEYGTPGVRDPNLNIMLPTRETHNMLVDGVPYKLIPVAHILATKNNTHIVITDARGTKILGKTSGGLVGFKNAGKRSDVAAQTAGYSVGQAIRREGYNYVKVLLRGLGKGREPSVLGLKMAGINVVSITDDTVDQTPLKPPRRPHK